MANLNELKRLVFYDFLNLTGRAYIMVKYSHNVILGKRGFTEEEKANGIILVFNSKMDITWNNDGINTTLIFNNSPMKCYIPADDIVLIYSPELDAQFATHLSNVINNPYKEMPREEKRKDTTEEGQTKIIKVDFIKKRAIDE